MFTGEYHHTVDEKGRLAVPARFRLALADGAFVAKWIDGCLAIFPRAAWDELAEKAATLPVTDRSARIFGRLLFASAFPVVPDGQGRVVVPASLREHAGLAGEVVVVGTRDHLELWSPAAWNEFSALMDRPEALAEALQGLGI